MESGAITDKQINASSEKDVNHTAIHGRLHSKENGKKRGSWSADKNDKNQWLQIDLTRQYKVKRVATQGKDGHNEWVEKYKLQYSDHEKNFQYYREQGNITDKVKINFIYLQVDHIIITSLTCF